MSDGCTCEKCIEMCRTYPCMPLPEEARKLILGGYGGSLMLDTLNWGKGEYGKILALRPAMVGHEHDLAPMEIAKAPCVFLRNNRCNLHILDLKPYEGRSCRHDTMKEQEEGMMATLKAAWNTEAGQGIARDWIRQFYTGDLKWTDPAVLAGGDRVQQDDLPPIGTCPDGKVNGGEIACTREMGKCNYQGFVPDKSFGFEIVCGRETAALAVAEQPAEPFEKIVWRALIATQQLVAGCPADCEESSCSCDKDPGEMPPECKENFMLSMVDPEDSW